ncbi:MAG TPA: hypothetical protein VFS36_00545 [Chitinophagaceae bacterium]|jgi:hypothetical protein|nr:hypothetical protein [Chitinophagaceae bacterium]
METTSAIRRVRHVHRPAAGRKRGTANQTSQRTPVINGNGFLNHCFRPFWGINIPAWKQAEKEFFASVSNLCALYNWPLPDITGIAFPQNVTKAYHQVKERLKELKMDGIIIRDKKRKACLATVKSYDTGYTLYYIPVRPLWLLWQDKEQQALYRMMLLLFRYLHQIADVPYYREESYLYNQYETLTDWLENDLDGDEEEKYRQHQVQQMKLLKNAGDELFPLIAKPFKVTELKQAIKEYEQNKQRDINATKLAEDFLKLYNDYPTRSLHSSMQKQLLHPDDSDYVYLEQYLSFFWSSNDCFYDTLMDMINCELQEMGFQEEPVSIQYFDHSQEKEIHDFDFEHRFFQLTDRLSELLNEYDKVNDD